MTLKNHDVVDDNKVKTMSVIKNKKNKILITVEAKTEKVTHTGTFSLQDGGRFLLCLELSLVAEDGAAGDGAPSGRGFVVVGASLVLGRVSLENLVVEPQMRHRHSGHGQNDKDYKSARD